MKSNRRGSESKLCIVQEKKGLDEREGKNRETGVRSTWNLNDVREACLLQEDPVSLGKKDPEWWSRRRYAE